MLAQWERYVTYSHKWITVHKLSAVHYRRAVHIAQYGSVSMTVKIDAKKNVFFQGHKGPKLNYIYMHTVRPYKILKIENALVKCMFYSTQETIFSIIVM